MKLRSLSADDIFISYSRADANTYAVGLADELTKKGFSCFFDRLGTDADKGLPQSLIKKLKSCRMLVLIATNGAGKSRFVSEEVDEFARANGTSRIVPIDFGAAINQASWYPKIEGIAKEPEDVSALETGDASNSVVNRIEKSFDYSKSKDRLRSYTIWAATVLAALILASLIATWIAFSQVAQAKQASNEAARERLAAKTAKDEAEVAKTEAVRAKGDAEQQKLEAARARQAAEGARRQAETASARAADADAKRSRAEELTRRAEGQQKLAEARTAEAVQREQVAQAHADKLNYAAQTRFVEQALEQNRVNDAFNLLKGQMPKPGAEDKRDFVWYYLWNLFNSDSPLSLPIAYDVTQYGTSMQYDNFIREVHYTPDGEGLIAVRYFPDQSERLEVWDLGGGSPKMSGREIKIEGGTYFSVNGKFLAFCVEEPGKKGVWVWNLLTGDKKRWMELDDGFLYASISDDGRRLAVQHAGGITLLKDQIVGGVIAPAKDEHILNWEMELSPTGETLVIADHAKGLRDYGGIVTLRQWDFETAREKTDAPLMALRLREEYQNRVTSLAFSPDGAILASSDTDRQVKLWSIKTGEQKPYLMTHEAKVWWIAFSPGGKSLASMSEDGVIKIWDAATGRERHAFKGTGFGLSPGYSFIAFSPNGKKLLTRRDKFIVGLNVEENPEVSSFKVCPRVACEMALAADGKTVAILAGWDAGEVVIRNTTDGSQRGVPLKLEASRRIGTIALSPDGRTLVAIYLDLIKDEAGHESNIVFWDLDEAGLNRSRPRVATMESSILFGQTYTQRRDTRRVVFSRDGKKLAIADEGTVELWDVATRRRIGEELVGHQRRTYGSISSLAFSPDGSILAVRWGRNDGVVLWDASASPHYIKTLEFLHPRSQTQTGSIVFSPDGKLLVSDDNRELVVWEIATDTKPKSLYGEQAILRSDTIGIGALAFSPDGKILASGGGRNDIVLWEPMTRQILLRRFSSEPVTSLVFSADGRFLTATGYEGGVMQWRAASGENVNQRFEFLSGLNPQRAQEKKDLVISNWALYLESLKLKDYAAARRALERGGELLGILQSENALAEEEKEWVREFARARATLP